MDINVPVILEKEDFTYKKLLLPFISGLLTSLGFYSTHFDFLIWFSLVPLFYCLFNYKISAKKGFLITFVYSITFYLGLLTWLFKLHPLTWVGFTEIQSLGIITLGWISFSLAESLSLSILGFLYGLVKPEGWKNILFVSSLWVIIEALQGFSDAGFTWGRLAISQYKEIYLIQSSNLFGSLFISFILILLNSSIALSFVDYFKNKDKKSFKYTYPVLILIVINLFYGFYTVFSKEDNGKEINTAIIQGNILSDQKWNMTVQQGIDIYLDLSKQALNDSKNEKIDLFVWPESAVRTTMENPSVMAQLKDFTSKNDTFLLTGIFDVLRKKDPNDYDVFNAMTGISPKGDILGKYYKRHLVPFGEYLPFKDILFAIYPPIKEINRLGKDITPGKSSNVFKMPFGHVGGLICYESIFPELIRESTTDGAEILILVTNDSWYKDSSAVYHHNGQAVFRSIENDRYMVRAANTGISSFISPTGQTIEMLGPLLKGYIKDKVKLRNTKTFYTIIGDTIVIFAIVLLFISSFKSKKTQEE